MAQIVLVHGIAQEQKAADVLEERWLPALAGGVRTAGFPKFADLLWREREGPAATEARMAFYGHVFLTPDQQGVEAEDLSSYERKIADDLALRWLERAAARSTNQKDKAVAARS
jgi:hypothetical protein